MNTESGPVSVTLDIVADEYDPHALLTAYGAAGEELARLRVDTGFRRTTASAHAWLEGAIRRPG